MSRKLFSYQGSDLHFGNKSYRLADAVKNYEQPVYLYDLSVIEERIHWIQQWSKLGRLHYAMKANFSLEILSLFKRMNCGIDVVSLGEIKHALKAGFTCADIIFSGVGKSEQELTWAIENDIYQINIESVSELKRIMRIAVQKNKKVSIGLRINPEIDAETHPSIATALKNSKFGLDFLSAREAIVLASHNDLVQLKAISFHLGSQIMNVKVYEKALRVVKPFYLQTKKLCPELDRLDLGGGIGIDYRDADSSIDQKRWEDLQKIFDHELKDLDSFLILEIGRFLVARSGVLLSRIEVIKETVDKKFMILDVGMSHLLRPALYDAYHEILPIKKSSQLTAQYDVVGPICESTDVLSLNKEFPLAAEGDFVAICDVGAYGSAMASRYNLRDAAIEVFI
ncbi:MAG: diaminopimelate decarboxylase [Bdellovibrio sp.]|nr:diaminopimelate decarboxylase [Bdellovibrio sp.]